MGYALGKNGHIPTYATNESACMDLYSSESVLLSPNTVSIIHTSLYLQIPKGYEVQIRPRSGLAYKHKLMIINSPGTIDSDYGKEIKILMYNLGDNFTITKGMRIAQMILMPIPKIYLEKISMLALNDMHGHGLGSTGLY